MAAALKNRTSIFFLNIACFFVGLCEKIIETALRNKVAFVLFSLAIIVLTLAALAGIIIIIVNVIAFS